MTNREKIQQLAQYLPSITQIDNEDTAAAVADVWLKALEMSPWDTLDQARFKEGMDSVTLISHVNSSVECALSMNQIIKKHHGIECDAQRLIVLGLLHDVDKTVQYVKNSQGELVISDIGRKIQHGVLTAMWAREAGFDTDMLHLILTHTHDQNMRPAFREGILFGYADLCDWEMTCKYTDPAPGAAFEAAAQ